jgi:hypothetical protein
MWNASRPRAVVENHAKDLRAGFPALAASPLLTSWLSQTVLGNLRQERKLAPLARQISGTKNLTILERCKDPAKRKFNVEQTKRFG